VAYHASVSSAKKKAKHILKVGQIDNQKEFDSICATLSREGRDDVESAELWKQLQALKTPQSQ